MNKLLIYIFSALFLASCTDSLIEKPKSLASENFYNTAAEVEAAVNAIYGPMRSDNGLSINYPAQLEGLADYGNSRGSQTPVSLYQGLDNTNINRVGVIWDNFYQSIRNANLVISNTPNGTSISDADKVKYIAEAKYLRSLIYFALVRNWSGVPIRTEANMTVADLKRSSVAEVYDLILSDALEAEKGLPDVPAAIGRPSKWAAKTLLSEIYMYKEDWKSSSAKAKEVIDSGKFSLVAVTQSEDFQKIYGPEVVNTPEEIFYFKYNRQQ
ncbi:MAG: RagB/SusD family nutrient uptake outer membrane protein, partial [Dyadobacter sp.]